MKLISR